MVLVLKVKVWHLCDKPIKGKRLQLFHRKKSAPTSDGTER